MKIPWIFIESGIRWMLLSAVVSACLGTPVMAADLQVQQVNKVKAAFVLNVARFVTWPAEVFEDADAGLQLCIYRTNPFGDALDSIEGKKVTGRQLEIIRVESLFDSDSCHLLLISQIDLDTFSREVHPGLTRPLLTVVDGTEDGIDSALKEGVMVTLVRKGSRIGFEINLVKTRSTGLKMSSELLKHARIVGEGS